MAVGNQIKMDRPFIFHFRADNGRRGVTVVFNPQNMSFGASICGKKDHFCRKLGRTIALARTFKKPIASLSGPEVTADQVTRTARGLAIFIGHKHKIKFDHMPGEMKDECSHSNS